MMGFLPAVSYIRGALVDRAAHLDDPATPLACVAQAMAVQSNPPATQPAAFPRSKHSGAAPASSFDSRLRELITWPGRTAPVQEPVTTDHPLIEATFMEGAAGWVVPLANYTGSPVEHLTVLLRVGDRPFREVRSSRQGVLKAEIMEKGVIRVTLPLESTDMIYAAWKGN